HSGRQCSEGGAANQPTSPSSELSHRREAYTWRPPPRLPIREDTRMRLIPSEHGRIPFLLSTSGVNNATTGSGVGNFAIVINTLGAFFQAGTPRSTGVNFAQQINSINSGSERMGTLI